MMSLSILIPVYNEAHRLENLFIEIEKLSHEIIHELVFVNDGSKDDSSQLLRGFQRQSTHKVKILDLDKNSGKGFA